LPSEDIFSFQTSLQCFKDLSGFLPADVIPWTHNSALPTEILPHHTRQHWWSNMLFSQLHTDLLHSATARDKCRLQCQTGSFTGAWLTAVPAPALGLSFRPDEFRCLLKWWLGIPQIASGHAVIAENVVTSLAIMQSAVNVQVFINAIDL
jgi:hypothetical protein